MADMQMAALPQGQTDAAPALDFSQGLRNPDKPGSYGGDLLRLAIHGLTMGFSDEALAAAGALSDMAGGQSFSDSYRSRVESERSALEAARENTGWAGTAAEIAGSLVLPGGMVARAGSKVGTRLLAAATGRPAAKLAGGTAAKIAGSAATGAGFGAVGAMGSAEPDPNAGVGQALLERMQAGVHGAMTGGAIGAAVPPALSAVGAVASPITNVVNSALRPAATAEGRLLNAVNRSVQTDGGASVATGRLNAEPATLPEKLRGMETAMTESNRMGTPSTLADVGGVNMQRQARVVQTVPGEGAARMEAFLKARQLEQPERVTNAISDAMGGPETFYKTLDKTIQDRSDIAGPLFETSFAQNPRVNTAPVLAALDKALETSAGSQRTALASVGSELTGMTSMSEGMTPKAFSTPQNIKAARVDLKSAHAVKGMLDDAIETAMRTGEREKAKALLGVKRVLVDEMGKASPIYDKARQIYAGHSDLINALEAGQAAVNGDAAAIAKELAGYTQSEREMFTLGIARGLRDKIENAPDGADIVKRVFGNIRMRNLLETVFPSQQAFEKFRAQMMLEAKTTETNQMVRGGSPTMRIAAEMSEGTPDLSAFGHLMSGRPLAAAQTFATGGLRRLSGVSPAVTKEMADMLTTSDPGVVQRLMDRQRKLKAAEVRGEKGRNAVVRGLTNQATD